MVSPVDAVVELECVKLGCAVGMGAVDSTILLVTV